MTTTTAPDRIPCPGDGPGRIPCPGEAGRCEWHDLDALFEDADLDAPYDALCWGCGSQNQAAEMDGATNLCRACQISSVGYHEGAGRRAAEMLLDAAARAAAAGEHAVSAYYLHCAQMLIKPQIQPAMPPQGADMQERLDAAVSYTLRCITERLSQFARKED